MGVNSTFSDNYQQARLRFLEAVKPYIQEGVQVQSFQLPEQGPGGEDLFTDVLTLGSADAANHILLVSATHGIEGFCGSACQTHALEQAYFKNLPDDLAVTFIHALNPYGFAWLRRVNENNIDQNRNFADHDNLPPVNPDYIKLLPAIIPESLHEAETEAANKVLLDYAAETSFEQLQAVLTEGQYGVADGVYYGGTAPSWSNDLFRREVAARMSKAKKVVMIDYHTGLGEYGYGELISEAHPNSDEFKQASAAFTGVTTTDAEAADSTSSKLQGTTDYAIHETLPDADIIALILEYGTIDSISVFAATRADNWLHLKGDLNSEEGKQIKQQIRDAFYQDKDDWKQMILDRSQEVLTSALAHLS